MDQLIKKLFIISILLPSISSAGNWKVAQSRFSYYFDILTVGVPEKRQELKLEYLPIKDLCFYHPLGSKETIESIIKKINHLKDILSQVDDFILEETLYELPRFNTEIIGFKVNDESYIIMEGNGRLAAFKHVFNENIKIPVHLISLPTYEQLFLRNQGQLFLNSWNGCQYDTEKLLAPYL